MPGGLPPGEVGKEISEHRARVEEASPAEPTGRDRLIAIVGALLLAATASPGKPRPAGLVITTVKPFSPANCRAGEPVLSPPALSRRSCRHLPAGIG
jgi:hypothetical protein